MSPHKWGFLGAIIAAIIIGSFGYASINHVPLPILSQSTALTKDSNISITIAYPGPGDMVDRVQQVRGKLSGKLPEGTHAWLVVSGYSDLPFRLWQPSVQIPDTDTWDIKVYVGGVNETGNKYQIAAVLVNEDWHDYFNYYIRKSNLDNYWWNVPLPVEFPIKDKIEVIRK
jgi:hypothetical protein